jgi:murein tripeptide amidase MpaA
MIKIQNNGKKVTLTFKANNKESFISAQEILSSVWYENWYDNLSYFKNVTISELGRTSEGRPISKILIGNNLKNPYIFLLGRQHPPEVTGAFALKSFIEGILNHNDLTKEFLSNFNIISYPLVNPDGVDLGHWRHNLSEKDLNRDWGFFSQIETSIIYEDIKKILKEHEIVLMIDFHSTFENIFYIQDQLETAGYNFAQAWLLKNSSNKNNYTFTIKPTKSTNNGVAKNYFYSSYDIPAITFEVGDNTDRRAIINSSENFANSMMRLLLENN